MTVDSSTEAATATNGTGTEAATGGPGEVERRAAFAAGAPGIPRRVIYWVLGVIVALGVGGALLSRVITSLVDTKAPSAAVAPLTRGGPITHGTKAVSPGASALHAPLSSFLDISPLRSAPAPGFTLTDAATGAPVSLSSLRGHVVVLTFANAACNDICPVLAAELSQAAALLGSSSAPVTFVTVNSDPLDVGTHDAAILSQPALAHLANWRFLTGTVGKLNPVWVSYGVSISAERSNGVASHNDLLYFIGPSGNLAWSAVPFADESKDGSYSLPAAEITRFARGIAHYAARLEPTT